MPADGVARQEAAGAVYTEVDVRLLGTVDLSSQEVALPTHPLSSPYPCPYPYPYPYP